MRNLDLSEVFADSKGGISLSDLCRKYMRYGMLVLIKGAIPTCLARFDSIVVNKLGYFIFEDKEEMEELFSALESYKSLSIFVATCGPDGVLLEEIS